MCKIYKSSYILFSDKNVVEVRDEEIKAGDLLAPDDILLEAEASIISTGTELSRLAGIDYNLAFPIYPGYGMIGRIVEKGDRVKQNIGERVFCAAPHSRYRVFTTNQDHQWNYLFPVPEDIDSISATLVCMMEIAMTAPNLSDACPGDTVAVYGLGVVGLLAALMFEQKGASVIGLDPVSGRCVLAKDMGVTHTVSVAADKQNEEIMKLTGNKGVHTVVDAVGHAAILANSVNIIDDFGEIISLGSPRTPYSGDLNDFFREIHLKCCTLKGAHMWQYPVAKQRGVKMTAEKAYEACFKMISANKINVAALISHVIPASRLKSDIEGIYAGLRDKPTEYKCVVIDWTL